MYRGSNTQDRNLATDDRVPLLLTYNSFNIRTRRIMSDNFNILTPNPETRIIFPELPLVSLYRCDRNLRDILVHSVHDSTPFYNAESSPCRRPMPNMQVHNPLDSCTRSQGVAHIPSVSVPPVSLKMLYTASSVAAAAAFFIGETGRWLRKTL